MSIKNKILSIFAKEGLKMIFDFIIKKSFFAAVSVLAVAFYGAYHFNFAKPQQITTIERKKIEGLMQDFLKKCNVDGSGISYAELSLEAFEGVRRLNFVSAFAKSKEFGGIRNLSSEGFFANEQDFDANAYKLLSREIQNEQKCKSVEINTESSNFINSLKKNIWEITNEQRLKNKLQPYKIDKLYVCVVRDTKKNIIYILSLNLDKGKNENAICENGNEFQTNLEAIRRKIKEYNKND